MRILIVASYAPSLVNFRGQLISKLITSGDEVCAAAPHSDVGFQSTVDKVHSMGAQFSEIYLSRSGLNPFADLQAIKSLYQLFVSFKPDCVLAYTAKPVIYSGLAFLLFRFCSRNRRLRYVALITGLGFAFTEGKATSLSRQLLRRLVQSLYRFGLLSASAVIFQNPDDQAAFQALKLIPRKATVHRVWGSGVDLVAFSPHPLFSLISIVIALLTTSLDARSLALGA